MPKDLSAPAEIRDNFHVRNAVESLNEHGHRVTAAHLLTVLDAQADEIANLRAQLEAKPQPEQQPDDDFLQYLLTAGVPDTCRSYCFGAFNEGLRSASKHTKTQPARLPYTLEECADVVASYTTGVDVGVYVDLEDVVTSLRGMAK